MHCAARAQGIFREPNAPGVAHLQPMAFLKLPDERPANGPLTLASFEEEKKWRGKGSSISGLSFPPLATQFNPSGSQASWPGLEHTRRTRLKTHLDPAIGARFTGCPTGGPSPPLRHVRVRRVHTLAS